MDIQRMIYVTFLETEGPFVKVWGQTDRSLPLAIENALQQVTPQFERGLHATAAPDVTVGLACCARFKDDRYYRARVTGTDYLGQGHVEVVFVDYGNRDVVPLDGIRTPPNAAQLYTIAPQARDFILSEVTLTQFDLFTLEEVTADLRYLELETVPICEIRPYIVIQLLRDKKDVTINLIERGLLTKVTLQSQQQSLQHYVQSYQVNQPISQPPVKMVPTKMASPSPSPPSPSAQHVGMPTFLSYKMMPLETGSEHEVYVSYVSDGPCLFSVQLRKLEGLLKRLMVEINSITLQPLEEYPMPGTVCFAQSSEDGYICRAVVTSMVDEEYKVFYVDFGNTEILQFDKLFQIPVKYVFPKVMATRFALAGLETANISVEMKCAFKQFVDDKLLRMRVHPAAAKSALPLCDLWIEGGRRAIDVVRESALLSYPEPVALTRGFSQDVKISYVVSCNKFYVQLKSKETELANLMEALGVEATQRPQLNEKNLQVGAPCYALYSDEVWYRAQIVTLGAEIVIKYVDYGNVEPATIDKLREPTSDRIVALRPQAIECCMNGYQNVDPDAQRDQHLQELIVEQDFNMKVIEVQSNRVLVELFDSAQYNVASLLNDKVASATSQVSPLLIQGNTKFEHRKRSPPQNYNTENRPLRELNQRNNESRNWRQNASSRNKSNPSTEMVKKNSGWFIKNTVRKNRRNQPRDGHESSDSKESYTNQRGPRRYDGPKKRFEQNEQQGDLADDEWGGNRNSENRSYGKRDQRNDNRFQGDHQHDNKFSANSRLQRQPRGSDFHQQKDFDNEDRPKRFNKYERNSEFPRDDRRPPRKFNRFDGGGGGGGGGGDSFRSPRQSNDFKREPSEKSFSDTSEKSWKKSSPRSHNNFDRKGKGKGFQKLGGGSGGETENWETPEPQETIVLAEPTDYFKPIDNLLNSTETVSISWFYNPESFYVQLEKFKGEFSSIMEEIQKRYRSRQTITAVVNQPVIALFPEDKVLYRAVVLDSNPVNLFRVRYVDYGNTATVAKVYAIEKKYMELPGQAVCCGLNKISRLEENWLEADAYSRFFDKENFSCKFVSAIEPNMYHVDLLSDGNDITEQLIAASLAVSPYSDIDINLLLGQQLMVLLKQVQSLDQIRIEIEPNLGFDASMHNLSEAQETFNDALNPWVGNFLIAYIDNVVGNKLEVTFYDSSGQKLKVLVPDEGAFETVDVLSPLPIYTRSLSGLVCYATSESVFLQPAKFEQTVIQLLDALYARYNEFLENVTPEIEGIYAVLSSDTNWYRGKVLRVMENNEEVEVSYLDYGNTEIVKVGDLRFLSDEFFQMHMLAIEIKIEGGNCLKYNNYQVSVIDIRYEEDCWVGKIPNSDQFDEIESQHIEESRLPEESKVEIQQTEEARQLKETEIEIQRTEQSRQPKETEIEVQQSEEVQIPDGVMVTLSHSDSPSEFYLQLSDDLETIAALQSELQQRVPELNKLENPTPGILCAAPYSVDGQWYRAQVLDSDDDVTAVRFVDYGNTDVINNKITTIKTLPPEFLTPEFHARLCSLYLKPIGEEWASAVIEKFDGFLGDKPLKAKILHQDEKTTYVDLLAGNENVGKFLIEENLATSLSMETNPALTGFISHLNSPSEFWMQLENSVPDLEWVAEQLTNASTFPVLEDLTPGSLCAAIFPEDDNWYRARILSNTVAGIEVIFIDYGNSFSCRELRELPEDLIMLPPLALKCSLQKPTGLLQWSQKATDKFSEISADGATVFDVNVVTTGETSIIELFSNGENISFMLLPETSKCWITHVNSLEDFFVQSVEDDLKLKEIQSLLIDADSFEDIEDPEIGAIIGGVFEGDWYRAKVLEKTSEGFCRVIFIDYGNETILENKPKRISEDCKKQAALAKRFKLEPPPRTKWAEDASENFLKVHQDNPDTVFLLEEASESVARLYFNEGKDIRIDLGTIKNSPIGSVQSSPKKVALIKETELNSEMPEPEETISDTSVCIKSTIDVSQSNLEKTSSIKETKGAENNGTPELTTIVDTSETIENSSIASNQSRPEIKCSIKETEVTENLELSQSKVTISENVKNVASSSQSSPEKISSINETEVITNLETSELNTSICDTSEPEFAESTSQNGSKDGGESSLSEDNCDKSLKNKFDESSSQETIGDVPVEKVNEEPILKMAVQTESETGERNSSDKEIHSDEDNELTKPET